MDLHDAAETAVDAVAEHLLSKATSGANDVVDVAVDRLTDLISTRLNGTARGRQQLQQLRAQPDDATTRRKSADLISRTAAADGEFADALLRCLSTVDNRQSVNQSWSTTTHSGFSNRGQTVTAAQGTGNIVNTGRLKQSKKTFHIGSVQFGMGGLVSGIAALAAVLTAGTGVVVANQEPQPDAVLADAVGQWHNGGGVVPAGDGQLGVKDITMTVSSSGTFVLRSAYVGVPAGSSAITCTGRVRVDGPRLAVEVSGGPCTSTSATVAKDKRTLTVQNWGFDKQALSFEK